mmetsp:Transcript_110624/g.309194  ORF Transcript_110624/g.309194 Transcript_110624/m.309194 type:complete len:360 (-) Transcript_110624:184-1263(-)
MGVLKAGLLCGMSQLSIPVGAALGICLAPVNESVTAKWMAFGAGALVFAVATDLFGETLHSLMRAAEEEEGCNEKCMLQFWKLLAQAVCCVVGAVAFVQLNKLVEYFAASSVGGAREVQPAASQELSTHLAAAPTIAISRPDDSSENTGGAAAAFRRSGTAVSIQNFDCPIAALRPLRQATTKSFAALGHDPVVKTGNVAFAMWLGVMLDGIPEALMMACKSSAGTLEPEFILAVCIANFPESFSGASLLVTQGMPTSKAFGMWLVAFVLEVTLCMTIAGAIGDINPDDSPTFSIVVSGAEGLTGGAMLTMIASAMLPEALHGAGEMSGILFILGFTLSVIVTGIGPVNEQAWLSHKTS